MSKGEAMSAPWGGWCRMGANGSSDTPWGSATVHVCNKPVCLPVSVYREWDVLEINPSPPAHLGGAQGWAAQRLGTEGSRACNSWLQSPASA